ncbi:hypothetical protein [Isorropodon fossajaponicum symbiont]|uniref:hypothetical protein n=1 Tax=Isorropodon fossajaponicum symbiont TaxID=883811 RepID=UPI001CECDC19|nr:hypothetical protein [Isorropodon fossajaponicum symbiont]
MNNNIKVVVSWLIALWASYVFLGNTIGGLFTQYGAYIVGGFELITSLVLLSPLVLWHRREKLHCIGGLMASVVMAGVVFFHLFTGWLSGVKMGKYKLTQAWQMQLCLF